MSTGKPKMQGPVAKGEHAAGGKGEQLGNKSV